MSCTLGTNYVIDCKNSKGGIKKRYVADFADITSYTVVAGAITALAMTSTKKFWTWNLERNNAQFTQSLKKNYDNGTSYYELKYDNNFKKLTAAQQVELNAVSQMSLVVMDLDNNGKYWVGGLTNGLDLMTSEGGSGKAMGDLNGYTISITGEEPNPVYEVPANIAAVMIVAAV